MQDWFYSFCLCMLFTCCSTGVPQLAAKPATQEEEVRQTTSANCVRSCLLHAASYSVGAHYQRLHIVLVALLEAEFNSSRRKVCLTSVSLCVPPALAAFPCA